MKVNFLIVGAQKSGTTALHYYLQAHPEIEMADRKEVHFFDNDSNFTGEVDYSAYHKFFKNRPNIKMRDKSTPVYMYWNEAPKRIWQYNPEMKLIVVLRNPLERVFSHWNMESIRNNDGVSFSEAIRSEEGRCREALPCQHRVFSYLDRSFYSYQIRRLWHYFSKDQVLILKHDEMRKDLGSIFSKVSDFLEISEFYTPSYIEINSKKYSSKMSQEDFLYLQNIFYHEIRMLENMLDWDCSDWLLPTQKIAV